jgi:Tol biopolymer transport system component
VQHRGELVRFDAKSRQFRPFLSAIWAEQLNFSRDGQWVAYVLYPEGSLWRSKLDGSERLQLTFPPAHVLAPLWSPDGKRIAFSSAAPGKPFQVYLVGADGGTPEQLNTGGNVDYDVCWSRDGESLFFVNVAANRGEARIFDLKTRRVSRLRPEAAGWQPVVSPYTGTQACSPDGSYISTLTTDSQAIMLLNTSTHEWTQLARRVVNSPAWSRDGQYVYFDSYPTKDAAVFRMRISDHKIERIVSLEGFRRAESGSLAFPWMGVTPDGSPLLVRDIGTQEIYALDWEAP